MAIVAALAVTVLKGSSTKTGAATSTPAVAVVGVKHAKTQHHTAPKPTAPPANAAETSVTVLNGTETTGLAHRISTQLQQAGYSQANALQGRPPGSNQVSVVQYAEGHRSEAESVASFLSVSRVEPLEPSVSALGDSASVVVVVGADKAASSP